MKDTFTLADLANFKLEPPKAEPVAPVKAETQNATESSTEAPVTSDVPVVSAESTSAPVEETIAPTGETVEQPEEIVPAHLVPKGRLNEVIEERNALRRFNEYLLAKEQVTVPATAAPITPVSEMPTLEALGFDVPKYEEAMKAWTSKQVEIAKTQGAQQATQATATAAFQERLAAYEKANPSVRTVLANPHLPQLAGEAGAIVVESEFGPQILHRLGSNPDEAVRITRLTPSQQAAAIGRIEGELRAKAIKPPQRTTPNITRAPNPPTPTAGRGNTPSIDPMKMSTKEWVAWDRQQTLDKKRATKASRSA